MRGFSVMSVSVSVWMSVAGSVATTTVLSETVQADFTATTILAIGTGAILATQLPRVGIPCNPLAIAVIVAAIGGLELLEAQVGGIFVKGRPWGTFLILGGLWELRPAVTRPSVSRQAV